MKKLLISLILLGMSTTAFAVAKPLFTDISKNKDVFVSSLILGSQGVEAVKFKDGDIICYVVGTKVAGAFVNSSISCVK